MRIQIAHHEAAAVEEHHQRKRAVAGRRVDAQPQVAARANAHWRVAKTGRAEAPRTAVEVLERTASEEELARMLSGEHITDAARAAARALMHA